MLLDLPDVFGCPTCLVLEAAHWLWLAGLLLPRSETAVWTLETGLRTSTLREPSGRLGDGPQFHAEAKPGELIDVMPGFDPDRASIGMTGPKILMVGPIL